MRDTTTFVPAPAECPAASPARPRHDYTMSAEITDGDDGSPWEVYATAHYHLVMEAWTEMCGMVLRAMPGWRDASEESVADAHWQHTRVSEHVQELDTHPPRRVMVTYVISFPRVLPPPP